MPFVIDDNSLYYNLNLNILEGIENKTLSYRFELSNNSNSFINWFLPVLNVEKLVKHKII